MGEAQSIDEVTVVGSYAELEFGSTQFDLVGPRINNWINMVEKEDLNQKASYSQRISFFLGKVLSYSKLLLDYEKVDVVNTMWVRKLGLKVSN